MTRVLTNEMEAEAYWDFWRSPAFKKHSLFLVSLMLFFYSCLKWGHETEGWAAGCLGGNEHEGKNMWLGGWNKKLKGTWIFRASTSYVRKINPCLMKLLFFRCLLLVAECIHNLYSLILNTAFIRY